MKKGKAQVPPMREMKKVKEALRQMRELPVLLANEEEILRLLADINQTISVTLALQFIPYVVPLLECQQLLNLYSRLTQHKQIILSIISKALQAHIYAELKQYKYQKDLKAIIVDLCELGELSAEMKPPKLLSLAWQNCLHKLDQWMQLLSGLQAQRIELLNILTLFHQT